MGIGAEDTGTVFFLSVKVSANHRDMKQLSHHPQRQKANGLGPYA